MQGGGGMARTEPTREELAELLGEPLLAVWRELCAAIDERYEMDRAWGSGGKR